MIEVKAPGKIMLAGEWSILEPGNSCIVLPVNKYVTVKIKPAKDFILNSEDIDLQNALVSKLIEAPKPNQQLCLSAIQNSLQFLQEQNIETKPFELSIFSEISKIKFEATSCKPGLGSSAAVVVATCKAILEFHKFKYTQEQLFKLAYLCHFLASGKLGSGFDIAASTYQKPVVYKRFDGAWLTTKLEPFKNLGSIIFEPWPGLEIQEIKLPDNMIVLIGFVGYSASTTNLIKKVIQFKTEHPEKYGPCINAINQTVLELIEALKNSDQNQILMLLNQNRDRLAHLSQVSDVKLETQELKQLIKIAQSYGAAAKISGAGGGDCGIAVCFNKNKSKQIQESWAAAKISCL